MGCGDDDMDMDMAHFLCLCVLAFHICCCLLPFCYSSFCSLKTFLFALLVHFLPALSSRAGGDRLLGIFSHSVDSLLDV